MSTAPSGSSERTLEGSGRRVLVTGGAGFLGTAVVPQLLEHHYTVTVLDNFTTGRRQVLEGIPVTLMEGDIRDRGRVAEATDGQDAVVHLAADPGVESSLADPSANAETNVIGTINVLDALRRANVGRESEARFILASSNAPLGNQLPPATEDKLPMPMSPYGAGKLACEAYCNAYHGTWGLGTVVLRFSNLYGRHSDRKSSVVAKFMVDILLHARVDIEGDGVQTRDFIHVHDVANAVLHALSADVGGEVFQIGTGRETSVAELARILGDIADRPFEVRHVQGRRAELTRNFSAIDKAKRVLGWEPAVSLEEGLRDTWAWFKEWAAAQPEAH